LSATRPSRGRSRIEDDVSPSFVYIRIPHDLPANTDIGARSGELLEMCQELVKKWPALRRGGPTQVRRDTEDQSHDTGKTPHHSPPGAN
jgi:hypothetical protein